MRKIIIAVLALSLLCFLVSCGNKAAEKPPVELDTEKTAAELLEKLPFSDELELIDKGSAEKLILAECEDIVMYKGSGATAEIIAIAAVSDSAAAQNIYSAFRQYVDDQKAMYESYMPSEAARLESAVVRTHGRYAFLCVCDDNSAADLYIDGILNGK